MPKTNRTTLAFEVGEVENGKNPQYVKCAECSHVWIGLYLPQPINVAAKMMKNLVCPKCGTGANRICMSRAPSQATGSAGESQS